MSRIMVQPLGVGDRGSRFRIFRTCIDDRGIGNKGLIIYMRVGGL